MVLKKHKLEIDKDSPLSFLYLGIVNTDSLIQTSWNINKKLPVALTAFAGLNIQLKNNIVSIPAFAADDDDPSVHYYLFPNKINDTLYLLPKLKTVNFIFACSNVSNDFFEQITLFVKGLSSTLTVTQIIDANRKYLEMIRF